MPVKEALRNAVQERADDILTLSHQIHAHPELGFQEAQAANWITETLSAAGFEIDSGVAGLETAFVATFGTGELTVGICAEYDALPEIGHACGHNIIAASAVGAALSLAGAADELDITVKVFGTPAEENGGGKVLMLDAGVFDGTHVAIMIHPAPHDGIACNVLAIGDITVEFEGKAAHASFAPFEGRNAGDAATLTQVAVGLLRQQLPPGDQVHGIVLNGGEAPNIIPQRSKLQYYARSETLEGLEKLLERVKNCARAGALATDSAVTFDAESPYYADFENHDLLTETMTQNFRALGREPSPQEVSLGSTDMGNVSRAIPSLHPMISIDSSPHVNHQPEFAAHCVTPQGDRAVIDGAIAMAWTVADLATTETARHYLLRWQK